MNDMLCTLNKNFNFTINYPKGHGDMFHDWMEQYHPGMLLTPVVCTLGGTWQDMIFKGAFPEQVKRSNDMS